METASPRQIKWHLDILPRHTKKAFNLLAEHSWLKHSDWYLAGGTALALQAGHRSSVDLDFFTPKDNFNNRILLRHFKNHNWSVSINKQGTIYGELEGAKISFISYPFFIPKLPLKHYGAICLLDSLDIAVMKIVAISQRGRKRDFFDLYWCAKNIAPLKKFILKLKAQYPSVAHDYHHILKSLVYFADAENDPTPKINFNANWPQVKKFFTDEVPKITKEIINLENY